ncbi:ABC transporter ATP-binding protein [Euzebya sp.]|uniref:ABC transporter ATP-binding protein n=1 Tax=Euzebya sp. TaxID=1971409 RepID=UPI003515D194
MTLTMTDITLTYEDGDATLTALDGIDLSVDAGEFAAVAGPSGSGKSSLLAVAGTLLRPQSGTVTIAGTDVTALDDATRTAVRADRIGFVFQGVNLLVSLTAVDQLLVGVHLRGGNPRARRADAVELLTELGLASKIDRRPHQLSGGERQRVGIARALINRPHVLLVDEPTSALDHDRGSQIVNLLSRLTHRHGVATLMVTHDRSQLDHVDTVHHLVDGHLQAVASAVP